MKLQPQMVLEPFEKWAIDFVGPINPPSCQHSYILICTFYVTKLMEEKELMVENKQAVVDFIHKYIFVRFGIPWEIVINGRTWFTSRLVRDLMDNYKIKHKVTTPYHP